MLSRDLVSTAEDHDQFTGDSKMAATSLLSTTVIIKIIMILTSNTQNK